MLVLLYYQHVILSTCYIINMLYYQHVILLTCYIINMLYYQHVNRVYFNQTQYFKLLAILNRRKRATLE